LVQKVKNFIDFLVLRVCRVYDRTGKKGGGMNTRRWDKRFLSTTRGRIVDLLRRRQSTVDELAQTLGLTDNAVRAHLATLERDGLVERKGVRRGPSKPAYAYDLTGETEQLFSRAYAPILDALLAELLERDGPEAVDALLQIVGKRLAQPAATDGNIEARLAQGAQVLNDLGGLAEPEVNGATLCIRGYSCPLASVSARYPSICLAAASLLSEVVGIPLHEQCERGESPHCYFAGVRPPEAAATKSF
jgi:predicted ArsR family transcriptional regulator